MRLAESQRAFAAHLRDPERVPAPADVEPRRMAVYRDLFIDNLSGLLAGAFPVARSILGAGAWLRLVRDFYARHRARTPYFHELPGEFVEWLRARTDRPADEPAFFDELAHYEWVELALAVSEKESPARSSAIGDPLDLPLAVSPLAWTLAYRWPVHRLGPGHQPTEPPAMPTYLVVFRDAADVVRFLEIGAGTARLLDALECRPGLSLRSWHQEVPESRAGEAVATVRDLLERGVLITDPSTGAASR